MMLAKPSPIFTPACVALSDWLMTAGIDSSKLHLQSLADGSYRLVAASAVTAGEQLLSLPASHLMSSALARQSAIGKKMLTKGCSNQSEQAFLAAYLLQERDDNDSFWSDYIKLLPTAFEHIPMFYKESELELLQGSQVLEMVLSRRFMLEQDFSQLSSIFDDNKHMLADYLWARTVVNTRSFDLNGELVLAPGMDQLAHSAAPNSLWQRGRDKRALELLSKKNLVAGEEITISYGNISNRQFYCSYGIVPDEPAAHSARVTLSLASGDPLYREKMALLDIQDTCIDVELGPFVPNGFSQAMTFMRVAGATNLAEKISAYRAPVSKSNEAAALQAFIGNCQQMLLVEPARHRASDIKRNNRAISENSQNALAYRRQEKQTLQAYILLASTALALLNQNHSLNFLKPDIEGQYLNDLRTFVKKIKEEA